MADAAPPPAAIETERAYLGACLTDARAFNGAAGLVDAEHFGEELHRQLWAAMHEIGKDGVPVSMLSIIGKLGNETVSEGVTLAQYLARCCSQTSCPPQYLPAFAKRIREQWALRALAAHGELVKEAAGLPGASAKALTAEFLRLLDETRARIDPRQSRLASVFDAVDSAAGRMNRLLTGEEKDRAISTGLVAVDKILGGGFRGGELIVCGARPGMGKTSLAVSLSRQSAVLGHAGIFFSLEMPELQIAARFLSDQAFRFDSQISASQVVSARVTDAEASRLLHARDGLRDLPLVIDGSSSATVGEIGARARRVSDEFALRGKKLELVVVDYLKFVKATDRYKGQRHYEVGEITAGLKALAKDIDVAVFLLVQLNREVEKTERKRPELSHLRESGDIEADADVVAFLYRDGYYETAADPTKLEIIIAKQRMGPTGTVQVFLHPGASAVRDAA